MSAAADPSGPAPAFPFGLPAAPEARAGSYPQSSRSYPSVQAFMLADRRRAPSAERDIGLRWCGEDGRTFRAAWVRETGELYTVQQGEPESGGGHVEVLGRAFSEQHLELALRGWEEICGEPASVDWLRNAAHRSLGVHEGERRGRRALAI